MEHKSGLDEKRRSFLKPRLRFSKHPALGACAAEGACEVGARAGRLEPAAKRFTQGC